MVLQKQNIPVVFSGGEDTKTDRKTLQLPSLLSLRNGRMKTINTIQKRNGCALLGQGILGSSSTLSDADALGFFNEELLQFNKQEVYSYSKQTDEWIDKGAAISVKVKVDDLTKNNYQQTFVDQAVNNDVAVTAWEDARGGIYITVFDYVSGTRLISDTQITATGTRPRCISFGANLFVFFIDAGSNALKGLKINPIQALPLASIITISTSVNSTDISYDAIADDQFIYASYNVQGATQIRTHTINENLVIQATVNIADDAKTCVTLIRGLNNVLYVFWYDTGGKIRGIKYTTGLVVLVAATDLIAVAGVVRICGYQKPATTAGVQLFYEISSAQVYNYVVKRTEISAALAPVDNVFLSRSVGIASKPWVYSPDGVTDHGFICVVHESTLQSTFFVMRNDGVVVAKMQYGFSGGLLARNMPGTVTEREAGKFVFAILTKNPVVEFTDTSVLTFKGVSIAELDFDDLSNFLSEPLGPNLHITGGLLLNYDGQSVVEHGFHLYPEDVSLAQSAGGSLTLLGTYSYLVVYAWTDSAGQIHRSGTSLPVNITLTGGNNRVTLTIPTLRITQKKAPRTDINIEIYRNENLGVVYYRTSSITTLLYNDTTNDTVTYVDDLADATLISRETVYTTGDVLDNVGAPNCSSISVSESRIILGGLEDNSIMISKVRAIGAPVEFADELRINLDPIGGAVISHRVMDDKIVFFKESMIWYIYGDGPDNTGGGNQFSPPILITNEVGCIDPGATVLMPQGIMFKSRKGIQLLNRSLQLTYIGAPVEAYNDLTISSAIIVPDDNEVRFTTLEGPCLVYDYFTNRWSHDDYAAGDSVVANHEFFYIRKLANAPSVVVKETPGQFRDISQAYPLVIKTGWISPASIQGFQRCYWIDFLGEYKSAHTLRISCAYDFVDVFSEDHTFVPKIALDISNYGDGAYYGSDDFYGSDAPAYQMRVGLETQKFEAILLQIEDLTQDESPYESFNITGMTLECGVKTGVWKTRAEATI